MTTTAPEHVRDAARLAYVDNEGYGSEYAHSIAADVAYTAGLDQARAELEQDRDHGTDVLRCATNGIGHYPPAVALVNGEPRCDHCITVMTKYHPSRAALAVVETLPVPDFFARKAAHPAHRLATTLTAIAAIDPSRHGHTGPDTPQVSAAYAQRNALIWMALALAHDAGIPAGVRYDPNDPRPVVVHIDLPTGQISWHLPAHPTEWDGHTTGVKYQRLEAFAAAERITAETTRPTPHLDHVRRRLVDVLGGMDDDNLSTIDLVHALAKQRDRARDANDCLALTLAEVIGHYRHIGGPGNQYYAPDWIPGATLARWRATLNEATQARTEQTRVVVVVDWTRQRVHGITHKDTTAQQWVREIVAKHGGNPLAATMTVGLVDTDPAPGSATRAPETVEALRTGLDHAITYLTVTHRSHGFHDGRQPCEGCGVLGDLEQLAAAVARGGLVTPAQKPIAEARVLAALEALGWPDDRGNAEYAGALYEAAAEAIAAVDHVVTQQSEPAAAEIGIEHPECIQVVMRPEHQAAYRAWLATRGLYLYSIPAIAEDDLPTYAVGLGKGREACRDCGGREDDHVDGRCGTYRPGGDR